MAIVRRVGKAPPERGQLDNVGTSTRRVDAPADYPQQLAPSITAQGKAPAQGEGK
jgi:hypothetical protein